MGNVNYKKVFAIKKANEKRILNVNPDVPNRSGIYFLTRTDEEGFRYAYIGQAKHLLERLAQHLSGFQRIDISIKAHSLYSADNIYGWKVGFLEYPVDKLDEMEQHWIKQYANNGYQLRNVTSGSQGEGKKKIDEYKPSKTYTEGKEAEKKRISKELAHLFDLHLDVTTKKNPPTVNQQKALDKFNELLEYHKEKEKENE